MTKNWAVLCIILIKCTYHAYKHLGPTRKFWWQELRNAFAKEAKKTGKPRLLVTAAVAAGGEKVDAGYEVAKVAKCVHCISLNDFSHSRSPVSLPYLSQPCISLSFSFSLSLTSLSPLSRLSLSPSLPIYLALFLPISLSLYATYLFSNSLSISISIYASCISVYLSLVLYLTAL